MVKVAHLACVTPHRAGLYETARDIVAAERALGIDARIVDPETPKHGVERGVPIEGHKWAHGADLWVSHSGPMKMEVTRDVIHVMHGRPFSSFMLGYHGALGTKDIGGKKVPVLKRNMVFNALRAYACDPHFKMFVTLWEDFLPYWRHMLPNVHYVPACVDLKRWTPDGPSGYGFHGKGGEINVVIADMWRIDKNPMDMIVAFGIFAQTHPGARLHIYGIGGPLQPILPLLNPLRKRGVLGELKGMVSGLANVYRAADMVICPHRIAVRTIREAMACGCTVVAPYDEGLNWADPEDPVEFASAMEGALTSTENPRDRAERLFDPQATARGMADLMRSVLGKPLHEQAWQQDAVPLVSGTTRSIKVG